MFQKKNSSNDIWLRFFAVLMILSTLILFLLSFEMLKRDYLFKTEAPKKETSPNKSFLDTTLFSI